MRVNELALLAPWPTGWWFSMRIMPTRAGTEPALRKPLIHQRRR